MYTIEEKSTLIYDFKKWVDKEDSYSSYSYEGVRAIYDYIEDQQYEWEDNEDLKMFKFYIGLTYTDIRIIFNETYIKDIKDIEDLKEYFDEDSKIEFNDFLKQNYDNETLSNGDHLIKVFEEEIKGNEIYKTLKSIISVNYDNH